MKGSRGFGPFGGRARSFALVLAAFGMLGAWFTTSAGAATFTANAGSLGGIPDGSNPAGTFGAPRDVTFSVSGFGAGAAPSDVQVGFTLSPAHTWVGDLDVQLIAPNGASHTIFSRTGATTAGHIGDSSHVAGPYTFADTAPASPTWWQAAATAAAAAAIPSGSYRTSTPGGSATSGANTLITPAFAGVTSPEGTWTLRFRDRAQDDTGTVSAASLRLTPGNDAFANAQVLQGSSPSATGTNVDATEEAAEPFYDTEDHDNSELTVTRSVWYRWTSPGTGPATVDLCTGTNFDSMLAVFTGAELATLSLVSANNNHADCAGTFASKVAFAATQGTTYQIVVDGCCGAPAGNFTLNVSGPPAPPAPDPGGGGGGEPPPGDGGGGEVRRADTEPPDTTITSSPRRKTTKRRATFTQTSTEPASTFQCSLDGAAFRSCRSPFTTPKLARGVHNFGVRAIDAAGNVDGTPATYRWKIKRKRKKKK